jgi:hypothetical protein
MHQTKKGRVWRLAIKHSKLEKMAEGAQKDKLKEAETAKAGIRVEVESCWRSKSSSKTSNPG